MEKRTERRKIDLEHLFENKMFLRIFSVIIAVIIWIALSLTLYPTIHKTVSNIPLSVNLTGTKAEREGLSVVKYDVNLVSATINGMRYEIGNYSNDDLYATVDASKISKAGEYNLDVKIQSKTDDEFSVENVTPSNVTVKLDYIQTVEKDLSVEANDVSASEGFTLTETSVSPEKIQITGPKDKIEAITDVKVKFNEKMSLSESYTAESSEIVLYENNKVIDQSDITLSPETYSIDFAVYQKKTLPFEIDIQDAPKNFDKSVIQYSFSDKSIDILSPNKNIQDVSSKHLGFISLKDIRPGMKFDMDVKTESGQINASGISTVTVKINKGNLKRKVISLNKSQIRVINKAEDNKISQKTNQISDITIYGSADAISSVNDSDFVAELDLNGEILKKGSYTKSVTIYAPDNGKVWAYGSYDITIEVK